MRRIDRPTLAEEDKLLNIRIRLNNILEHQLLITNLIKELEDYINKKKLSRTASEIIFRERDIEIKSQSNIYK